jgi:hypothetical protein
MKKIVLTASLLAVLGCGLMFAASRSAEDDPFTINKKEKSRSKQRSKKIARSAEDDPFMIGKKEKDRSGRYSKKHEKKRSKKQVKKIKKSKPPKVKKIKEKKIKPPKIKKIKQVRSHHISEKEQARRLEREQRKARLLQEKEERAHKIREREERKQQERHDRLVLIREKELRKQIAHREDKDRRAAEIKKLVLKEKKRVDNQAEHFGIERQLRADGMARWKELHALEVHRDYDAGRYADLYKLPSWPGASQFFEKKDNLNLSVSYKYATDSYADDRSRSDITGIAFGYQPIKLQDILLASKLVANGTLTYVGSPALRTAVAAVIGNTATRPDLIAAVCNVNDQDAIAVAAAMAASSSSADNILALRDAQLVLNNNYVKSLAATQIKFNGQIEEYGTSLDFARYILGKNVQLGTQIPVLYRHHKLTTDFKYINDVLSAKGISEMGGSATGLGDVVLFANAQTGARTFEKVLGGFKVTFPTGKKASTYKLWAPELGTGHTQFSVYTSMLMDHSRLLNPHVYVEGIYSMPAHEDHRLPVKVTGNITRDGGNNATLTVLNNGQTTSFTQAAFDTTNMPLNNIIMGMGERLAVVASKVPINTSEQFFSEYDTSIKGFGDKAFSVKVIRGLEFKARVGNIIEKFMFRRGFLDIYYDLRAKFKDAAHSLNNQEYNLDVVSDRTSFMAHKLGTEFTYQFDADARLRAGINYTFAGINTPKAFEINSAFGYSF